MSAATVPTTTTAANCTCLPKPEWMAPTPARTINKAYRTTPLRGLWQHAPYFHDGSAATLADVVVHYDQVRNLHLSQQQQSDLVEYLKTL
jgi:cytochrome c peroxidase